MIKSSARSFDFVRNVLTCSSAYLKKASQLGTEEYREVLQYRHDNPGMTIEVMEKKPAANRPASITFAQMEKFISLCRDSENRLNQFQKIKSLSKIQSSPYSYVKPCDFPSQGFNHSTSFRYLYTVGRLRPHIRASSDTFICCATNAG